MTQRTVPAQQPLSRLVVLCQSARPLVMLSQNVENSLADLELGAVRATVCPPLNVDQCSACFLVHSVALYFTTLGGMLRISRAQGKSSVPSQAVFKTSNRVKRFMKLISRPSFQFAGKTMGQTKAIALHDTKARTPVYQHEALFGFVLTVAHMILRHSSQNRTAQHNWSFPAI